MQLTSACACAGTPASQGQGKAADGQTLQMTMHQLRRSRRAAAGVRSNSDGNGGDGNDADNTGEVDNLAAGGFFAYSYRRPLRNCHVKKCSKQS